MDTDNTHTLKNSARQLWLMGEIVTERYRNIELIAYPQYLDREIVKLSEMSNYFKKSKSPIIAFLLKAEFASIPSLPPGYKILTAKLNLTVPNHLEALSKGQLLVDYLLDSSINANLKRDLQKRGRGFLQIDDFGYGFILNLPEATTLTQRVAIEFGWEVVSG